MKSRPCRTGGEARDSFSAFSYSRSWTTQQTAPSNNSIGEKFRVTHPFHPLRGEELEVEGRTGRWGEELLWFRAAGGNLRTIPLRFTSWAAMEPYVEVGGGRSWYRASDLVELVRLIEGLR